MNAPYDPWKRVEALEALTSMQQTQIASLAAALATLSAAHAALCGALGQNLDALPGEQPLGADGRKSSRKAN